MNRKRSIPITTQSQNMYMLQQAKIKTQNDYLNRNFLLGETTDIFNSKLNDVIDQQRIDTNVNVACNRQKTVIPTTANRSSRPDNNIALYNLRDNQDLNNQYVIGNILPERLKSLKDSKVMLPNAWMKDYDYVREANGLPEGFTNDADLSDYGYGLNKLNRDGNYNGFLSQLVNRDSSNKLPNDLWNYYDDSVNSSYNSAAATTGNSGNSSYNSGLNVINPYDNSAVTTTGNFGNSYDANAENTENYGSYEDVNGVKHLQPNAAMFPDMRLQQNIQTQQRQFKDTSSKIIDATNLRNSAYIRERNERQKEADAFLKHHGQTKLASYGKQQQFKQQHEAFDATPQQSYNFTPDVTALMAERNKAAAASSKQSQLTAALVNREIATAMSGINATATSLPTTSNSAASLPTTTAVATLMKTQQLQQQPGNFATQQPDINAEYIVGSDRINKDKDGAVAYEFINDKQPIIAVNYKDRYNEFYNNPEHIEKQQIDPIVYNTTASTFLPAAEANATGLNTFMPDADANAAKSLITTKPNALRNESLLSNYNKTNAEQATVEDNVDYRLDSLINPVLYNDAMEKSQRLSLKDKFSKIDGPMQENFIENDGDTRQLRNENDLLHYNADNLQQTLRDDMQTRRNRLLLTKNGNFTSNKFDVNVSSDFATDETAPILLTMDNNARPLKMFVTKNNRTVYILQKRDPSYIDVADGSNYNNDFIGVEIPLTALNDGLRERIIKQYNLHNRGNKTKRNPQKVVSLCYDDMLALKDILVKNMDYAKRIKLDSMKRYLQNNEFDKNIVNGYSDKTFTTNYILSELMKRSKAENIAKLQTQDKRIDKLIITNPADKLPQNSLQTESFIIASDKLQQQQHQAKTMRNKQVKHNFAFETTN